VRPSTDSNIRIGTVEDRRPAAPTHAGPAHGTIGGVDTRLALRAAVLQAIGVAVLGLATGLALPHSFFEDWGWLVGPAAWIAAALFTAGVLRLPLLAALAGAAVAGVVSLAAVLIGIHWLGAAIAVVVFALWCGRLRPRRPAAAAA
jgi:hypothetical protein